MADVTSMVRMVGVAEEAELQDDMYPSGNGMLKHSCSIVLEAYVRKRAYLWPWPEHYEIHKVHRAVAQNYCPATIAHIQCVFDIHGNEVDPAAGRKCELYSYLAILSALSFQGPSITTTSK
eukprot:303980-Chlamydomonas_euryale.AAC.20